MKVNWIFHSIRRASKPLLTHMRQTLAEASEKLICFRSVSRTTEDVKKTFYFVTLLISFVCIKDLGDIKQNLKQQSEEQLFHLKGLSQDIWD